MRRVNLKTEHVFCRASHGPAGGAANSDPPASLAGFTGVGQKKIRKRDERGTKGNEEWANSGRKLTLAPPSGNAGCAIGRPCKSLPKYYI